MSDMQDTLLLGSEGIKKTILHGGTGDIPKLTTGAKVLSALSFLFTLSGKPRTALIGTHQVCFYTFNQLSFHPVYCDVSPHFHASYCTANILRLTHQ